MKVREILKSFYGFCNFVSNFPDHTKTPKYGKRQLKRCLNRPFPSSKKSHFQKEAKCETFVVKMSFICIIIKTHFQINGFALSLALKVRFFGTQKWPIVGIYWSRMAEHCCKPFKNKLVSVTSNPSKLADLISSMIQFYSWLNLLTAARLNQT